MPRSRARARQLIGGVHDVIEQARRLRGTYRSDGMSTRVVLVGHCGVDAPRRHDFDGRQEFAGGDLRGLGEPQPVAGIGLHRSNAAAQQYAERHTGRLLPELQVFQVRQKHRRPALVEHLAEVLIGKINQPLPSLIRLGGLVSLLRPRDAILRLLVRPHHVLSQDRARQTKRHERNCCESHQSTHHAPRDDVPRSGTAVP